MPKIHAIPPPENHAPVLRQAGTKGRRFISMSAAALTVFYAACLLSSIEASSWQEIKGKHFVAYYLADQDKILARRMLQQAEKYYQKIAARIGYTRYSDFWTWDERVKILLFPDQHSFLETTGQPLWTLGYSARDEYLFHSRAIVTYVQEQDFIDGVLPHEIGHLIVHDFIPSPALPIWLDEGIAQWEEHGKSLQARQMMTALAARRQHMPFDKFVTMDVRRNNDPRVVRLFYAQSLSVVEFLIKRYGQSAFQQLCRSLRDGNLFETALRQATQQQLKTIPDLEKEWIGDIQEPNGPF